LITSQQKIIGVIQIINAKTKSGKIREFTEKDKIYVNFFANNASVAIEKAKMTRDIILRMIKMAELRDPKETGNHVNRVASYSIEIYEKWAKNKNIDWKEIKKVKDNLRIAAMLHDVGKVAISDTILKKPGKLDYNEYEIMKKHTIYGARLFDGGSEWDSMAADVAINHHEKWDGTGYPGFIDNIYNDNYKIIKNKKGDEISIYG
ncbi:MAG: HD domain-containing protein, partial [Spirochaetes bacterium]|nr:HD domain-containing protein [Spirochaetota bacterium]